MANGELRRVLYDYGRMDLVQGFEINVELPLYFLFKMSHI